MPSLFLNLILLRVLLKWYLSRLFSRSFGPPLRYLWSSFAVLRVQPGPRWVWIPVLLRVLFIPFFMLCNVKPATRSMPVLFGDYTYCVGSIIMAFTSGYFSSVVMMYAPRYVHTLPLMLYFDSPYKTAAEKKRTKKTKLNLTTINIQHTFQDSQYFQIQSEACNLAINFAVRLSPVHTVAEKCDCRRKRRDNGDSRQIRRQSHFSATVWTGF